MSAADAPDRDRRRHARGPVRARAELLLESGVVVPVEEVLDVSAGGLLVQCAPPRLGTMVLVRVVALAAPGADASEATVRARVVRVVWGGRDRGVATHAGAALAFEDDEARRLGALLVLATPDAPPSGVPEGTARQS